MQSGLVTASMVEAPTQLETLITRCRCLRDGLVKVKAVPHAWDRLSGQVKRRGRRFYFLPPKAPYAPRSAAR
jgi:hypothetical protein